MGGFLVGECPRISTFLKNNGQSDSCTKKKLNLTRIEALGSVHHLSHIQVRDKMWMSRFWYNVGKINNYAQF
jgi:hypothetical protein